MLSAPCQLTLNTQLSIAKQQEQQQQQRAGRVHLEAAIFHARRAAQWPFQPGCAAAFTPLPQGLDAVFGFDDALQAKLTKAISAAVSSLGAEGQPSAWFFNAPATQNASAKAKR